VQLIFTQLAFYGTGRFIIVFTRARQINPVHSLTLYFLKINFNIILSSKSRSSKWPVPFSFSGYTFFFYFITPVRATCPTHLILNFITLTVFGVNRTSYEAPHYAVFSSLPALPPSQILSSAPGSRTTSACVKETNSHAHRKQQVNLYGSRLNN